MINPTLEDTEPEIAAHLKQNFDKFEIRGEESLFLQAWVERGLVIESVLNLLRQGLIDFTGVKITGDSMDPLLRNNPKLGTLVKCEPHHDDLTVDDLKNILDGIEDETPKSEKEKDLE